MFARITAAVLGALLIATAAFAQAPTGTILGSIKDGQGGVIPGTRERIGAGPRSGTGARTRVTSAAGATRARLGSRGGGQPTTREETT